ncbi:hypothetical protein OS493_034764 [Desmophyllum pertusum]|uniref:Uncharacterized protein n=1 Tax=Desmophyllum pertusum TaxID=174260 RepID=A0A9X0CNY1_9CNID|nr:hypothetical protein OS493_034764 [Desmophyllum pertusum]
MRKLLKSRTLDPRQLSKKVARLMKSRPHHSADLNSNDVKRGNSDSTGDPESIKHRPEETTGDFIGSDWIAKYRESSPEGPMSTPERTQTSEQPDGLTFSEIRKLLKSRTLESKTTFQKGDAPHEITATSLCPNFDNNDVNYHRFDRTDPH